MPAMSHAEIGAVLGFSDEYIRQIEKRALYKLSKLPEVQQMLIDYYDDPRDTNELLEAILNARWPDEKYIK